MEEKRKSSGCAKLAILLLGVVIGMFISPRSMNMRFTWTIGGKEHTLKRENKKPD